MRKLLAAVLLLCAGVWAQSNNPVYTTIRNNDLTALKGMLGKPSLANDRRGTTPLMYSAAVGSLDAMKLLVEAGANVNAANDFGATALMWSACDAAKARYLLSKGANVKARSKVGRTPLAIAATCDGSVEIARLMIEKGADVKAADESGMSVLESASSVNNVAVARLLLEKGADPNTVDGGGYTALSVGAGSSEHASELVKLLLDHKAQVNVKSGDSFELVKNGKIKIGWITPLMQSATQADFRSTELLVNAGADVNAKDIRGVTPLGFAVATDHADARIVKLLLAKGSDPKIKSVDGETMLDWARKYRNPEVLQALGITVEKLPASAAMGQARNAGAAIQSAVALMQGAGGKFLEAGGCLSCHAQHMTALAVDAARAAGMKINWETETAQAKVTASLRGGLEQMLFQVVDPPAGVDSQQFSLMQTAGAEVAPSLSLDSLLHHIAAMQRADGEWPNYGLSRPPLEDGGFSHTAKGIRALSLYVIPGRRAELEDRIARAAAWLEHASPVTTEDRAMQLLGTAWAHRKAPAERVKQLAGLQRADGGWGQTENLATDAYATGEALYALSESGMAVTDPVYKRGVDFLLRTQLPDGSWHVKTRALAFQPYFQSGYPHDHDQWISQAGAAWAVVALSKTMQRNAVLAGVR